MKRNHIFKAILVSVSIALAVGTAGSFARASQGSNKENQVVKTMVENNDLIYDYVVDEVIEYEDTYNEQAIQGKEEIKDIQNVKEQPGKEQIKAANTSVKKNKEIKTENIDKTEKAEKFEKVGDDKKESEPIADAENLKDENCTKQFVTKSGFARDYYEKEGDLYIVFDEAEFFMGEDAKKQYFKDGNTEEPMDEWGNDYYIRNNDNTTKVYKISKNSKLEMCSFQIGLSNSTKLVTATVDNIKQEIDRYKGDKEVERALLFNIDENDGVIYGMRSIYTP